MLFVRRVDQLPTDDRVAHEEVHMKYSLSSIPVEVLALAFIEFTFVSVHAAVLWYVLGGK